MGEQSTGKNASHSEATEDLLKRFVADSPQAMTDEDVDRLHAITGALGTPSFPASRERLISLAESHGAREAVVVDLRSLPDGARFETYDALLLALGVGTAGRIDVAGVPPRDPQGGASGE